MKEVTLYGLDKSGGYKVWTISTEEDKVIIVHGKEGGKLQTKVDTVKPKNIGRSNETTPSEQAELEAQSRINKQKDRGYRKSKEELSEVPLLPMLAHDYLKQGHRINYPCYVSRKLDGVRCLAICHQDRVQLKSRGGKDYHVEHIQKQLESIMIPGEVWDGELYIHGKYLEEIVSSVKKPNENTKDIKFVIFDIVVDTPFEDRLQGILLASVGLDTPSIESLDYEEVLSEADMKLKHKEYVSQGYEGIMLRNNSGKYESGKRSADLQKYKEFMDEEFEIVDVVEDRNGNAVFECFDPTADAKFTVTYGDFEQRKHQLNNPEEYIGKQLTVKYQARYKDSKLPQFHTSVVIRSYE